MIRKLLARVLLIYISTILLGSFVISFFMANYAYEIGIGSRIKEFLENFIMMSGISGMYAAIPGITILFVGVFTILKLKKIGKSLMISYLILGLICSLLVTITLYFFFGSFSILEFVLFYAISGTISCIFVPKFMGDYKTNSE